MAPWLGDVYEFHFEGSYAYSYFDKVADAKPSYHHPFHVNLLYFDLDFVPSSQWSIDMDIQFAESTKQAFNFRTAAIQGRYAWLDDVIGDPISLTTSANIRFTPTYALHDVSCPSYGNADFELNLSLGKELASQGSWLFRTWFLGAVGHANRGSPWLKGLFALETHIADRHTWSLLAEGLSGYGRETHIDVDHFDGYARVRNKSIDVALRYGYRMGVWGTIRFEYIRRFLAKACPEQVNTGVISYRVPFSF